MALQQHFTYAGGASKVAVDLEWRMSIEKVRIGTTALSVTAWTSGNILQQFLINMISLLGIVQTRPEINALPRAPARGLVAFLLQSAAAGVLESGDDGIAVHSGCEVMAGKEAYEMRLMAVVRVVVIPVVVPLVEVTVMANRIGVETGE